MTAERRSAIVNFVLYQAGWLACVVGGARGWGAEGAAVAFALVGVHLLAAERRAAEWPLLLAAAALGLVVDTLHGAVGALDFAGHRAGTPAPFWVIALWVQFATVLHFCMRWLSGRYRLAIVLGAIGGPLAFLAGERIGAAAFGEPRGLALAMVATSWAIALPLLLRLADRLPSTGRYRWLTPAPPAPRAAARGGGAG